MVSLKVNIPHFAQTLCAFLMICIANSDHFPTPHSSICPYDRYGLCSLRGSVGIGLYKICGQPRRQVFLRILRFSLVNIIPPFLHTRLFQHVALTRRTSGTKPGNLSNVAMLFRIWRKHSTEKSFTSSTRVGVQLSGTAFGCGFKPGYPLRLFFNFLTNKFHKDIDFPFFFL